MTYVKVLSHLIIQQSLKSRAVQNDYKNSPVGVALCLLLCASYCHGDIDLRSVIKTFHYNCAFTNHVS